MTDRALKTLRNRFFVLLTLSFSSMVALAFFTVYMMTSSNLQRENQQKLTMGEGNTVTVRVDEEGEILDVSSKFDLDGEMYEAMTSQAFEHQLTHNTIQVAGYWWMYVIGESELIIELDEEMEMDMNFGLRDPESNDIIIFPVPPTLVSTLIFLDVTDAVHELNDLRNMLLTVGPLMFMVILMGSFLGTTHAIKPIIKAHERQKGFIANASHELKTPLTMIKSNYDILLDQKEETIESQLEWLEGIEFGFERMTHLVNDFLILAQLDQAEVELKHEVIELTHMIEEILRSMEAKRIQKGIYLRTRVEATVLIQNDRDKVMQVLIILLDNAMKYTEDQGIIEISLMKSRHQVTFQIKNSGPGIPKGELNKIFDRFYRVNLSRNSEGKSYGLGLSIAKVITEKIGGKIEVQSIENEWTTFSLTLNIK